MIRLRAAAVTAMVVTTACVPSGTRPSAAASDTRPMRHVIPMDSASAVRLCTKPDLVRAGIAECMLRDQSLTPELRPLPR